MNTFSGTSRFASSLRSFDFSAEEFVGMGLMGDCWGDIDLFSDWLFAKDEVARSIKMRSSSLNESRAGGEHGRTVPASHCRKRMARRGYSGCLN